MKNKIFSILLVAILLLQTGVLAKSFSDVSGHWSEPYVQQMTDKGFINGFEDGTFKPDASVTRADALVLISRVLGASDKTISEFTDTAYNIFYKDVKNLGYPGYEKGFAHLLYHDVFSVKELTAFVENDLGRTPLKRYEAAILLVKLLGQEDTVLQNTMPILSYKDADKIPVSAQAYVEFCADTGLMQGVGDNLFSPETEVTRGQIAKMLCTAIEQLNLSYTKGVVTGYDKALNSVTYTSDDGKDITFEISSEVIVKRDAHDLLDTSLITVGDRINITCKGDLVVMVEFVSVKPDTTYRGMYLQYINGAGYGQIEVQKDEDATSTEVYKVAENCEITYGGASCDFSYFPEYCYIEFKVEDGAVVWAAGNEKQQTVEGVVAGFVYSNPAMLEVTLSDGSSEKFEFDPGLQVSRNGVETSIKNLYVGDKVVLGIYYGKIRYVTAQSENTQINGTIKKIVISSTDPSITIATETGDRAYDLSGKELSVVMEDKPVTIYDLRLGFKATVMLEGTTVTKIVVTEATVTEKFTITGTVVTVDTTYDSIKVKLADGTQSTVFVNDNTVIIDSKTGQAVEFANIPVGSTIISIVSPDKLNNVAISIAVITE